MRDVTSELKELRLHGMASAWTDLTDAGTTSTDSSRWLIEHLLQAESTDRAMRSVRHQLTTAKFPVHRDLAGFDFESSKVDQDLVGQLSTMTFTDTAQNAVLIGGPGTGKMHLAIAIAVSGIASKGSPLRRQYSASSVAFKVAVSSTTENLSSELHCSAFFPSPGTTSP